LSAEASSTAKRCSRSPEIAAHDALKSSLTIPRNPCSRSSEIRAHDPLKRALWQNGFAERLIGSIRRECVDHIIVWRRSGAWLRKKVRHPWLGGPPFDHVLGDARLRDLKPKLEQFTVDARHAPKRIFDAHPLD
jgi:hypothetical protein